MVCLKIPPGQRCSSAPCSPPGIHTHTHAHRYKRRQQHSGLRSRAHVSWKHSQRIKWKCARSEVFTNPELRPSETALRKEHHLWHRSCRVCGVCGVCLQLQDTVTQVKPSLLHPLTHTGDTPTETQKQSRG